MGKSISVIIPNYNKSATIGKCLEAAFSSRYENFEVIAVDDCSTDNSLEVIKKFPCKLIQLKKHSGASKARNTGAENSRGEVLFFTDSDCLLKEDALALASKTIGGSKNIVIGGTYTRLPYDDSFFSTFQSIFINYSETRKKDPDYIPAHALIIDAQLFRDSGGFQEDSLPILEDVEFSHRLRRSGCKLVMNPEILVQHILFSFIFGSAAFLVPVPLIFAGNIVISRRLMAAFYETKGLFFTIAAILYYTMLYPLGLGAGALAGTMIYLFNHRRK
ncbi:MAG: glycosyltransferase family 2 protein [Nitrospirae bacterium]|nr:glycosyltransferase family 2 protein [Nitrospirota bacterium]